MPQREIALDTETTGFKPEHGHRVVEIGAVEMINRVPTGRVYHQYINPLRDMPLGAYEVHGLSSEFLADYPTFDRIVDAFLDFIGDATLVIHNAPFDMGFINHHLKEQRKPMVPDDRIFCTLDYARKTFPGAPASLDALCKRFNVDTSNRIKHGALLDAELLADMYLELLGGAQDGLNFESRQAASEQNITDQEQTRLYPVRSFAATEQELAAHQAFVEKHLPKGLWKQQLKGL